MGQFVKVGTVVDFEDVEGGKLVDVGGRSLGIFRVGTNYYANRQYLYPIVAGLWRKACS